MKTVTRSLLALPLLAIALGGAAPMYAGAVVEGSLGQNLDFTSLPGMTLYDTGPQNGSPVSDVITWSFACSTCTGYGVSGSGGAKVIDGSIGATSSVSVTGTPGVNYIALADSTADYTDTLTITGGSGSGVLVLQYAVDGSTTQVGTGPNVTSFASLSSPFASDYQMDGGSVTSGSEADFFGDGTTNDTVTFYIPFTYGTAFSTELDIEAAAGFGSGDVSPFTGTVAYFNTATLDSALVFDGTPLALGTENTGAAIGAASGLDYGPNGISATPEPGTWFLVAFAMGVVGLAKRRRAFGPTR